MIETLAMIEAPHFTAGIVVRDDVVVEAADIVKYMARNKWTRAQVRAYCARKQWRISVVSETYDGRAPRQRPPYPPGMDEPAPPRES